MFRSIGGVTKSFATVYKMTQVWFLACVWTNVNLEILLPREGLDAAGMLQTELQKNGLIWELQA